MRAFRVTVLLLAGAASLLAQPAGTISGTVLSIASGAALAGSSVTLAFADGSPVQTVTADRRGRYLFTGLTAGYYALRASRTNFLTGRFGQKTWNHTGVTIELATGAAVTADVRLHRLGAVSGVVLDENGEGFPNVTVQAVTADAKSLTGRVSSAGITDDRGVFRIAGLRPGRYFVSTAAREMEDGTGYLPTYYPGVANRGEAQIVKVDLDSDTPGLRLQPVAGHLARLAGSVPAALKTRDAEVTVTLFRDEDSRQIIAGPGGQFAFAGIVPGRYTLVAELRSSQGRLASYQSLDLLGDVEGLMVETAPAPDVQVRLSDENGAAVSDPQILVFLARVENAARTAPVKAEATGPGAYRAAGLMPGRWRFFVVASESYALDAVRVGSSDALDGFVLQPGRPATATIRLARRAGLVRGHVTDASGRLVVGVPVVCYPLDARNRARLGGYRSGRTSVQGEYRFGGLPVGQYLVLAAPLEEFDPEPQLDEWKSRAPAVEITGGREMSLDLHLLE